MPTEKRPRIGMILACSFPPDIRVEKEAKTLQRAGYDVHLLCNRQSGKPDREVWNGITLSRRGLPGATFASRAENALGMLTFFYPHWYSEIRRWAKHENLDCLHVHDLPLAGTGLRAARSLGLPFVVDLHENYPAGLQFWTKQAKGTKAALKRLLTSYSRWLRYEGRVCRRADRVITVVDEMSDRLVRTHHLDVAKPTVVSNTEEQDFLKQPVSPSNPNGHFVLSYLGGLGAHRGIETAIRAMGLLRAAHPDIRLVIVGKSLDGKYEAELTKLVSEQGVSDTVEMRGWQPFSAMLGIMKASDVCLVPHEKNEHTDSTVPHKLFQYMMAERPVLVSDCRPLQRIVEKVGGGLVFQAGSPRSFADAVIRLYEDRALAGKLAKNGFEATTAGNWNWETESRSLLGVYSSLLN